MNRLEPLTPETTTGASRELLTDLVTRHGGVDNLGRMVRTMAHSPSVLGGYLQLSRALRRSVLSRTLSERISLAVQERLGCQVCLEAHAEAARALGLDEDEIALARVGTSADPRIAAMVEFGLRVHTSPGTITDDDVRRLRELGYRDRAIADVVALVALNVLTGAFNLVAGLEPEPHPARV